MTTAELLTKSTLTICGELNDVLLKEAASLLADRSDATEVIALFSSSGGEVGLGRALHEYLRLLGARRKVYGLVVGVCESSALSAFMAIDQSRRFCTPESSFLIHELSSTGTIEADGPLSVRRAIIGYQNHVIAMHEFDQNWTRRIVAKGAGLTEAEVGRLMDASQPLDATAAASHGLVSSVLQY